MKIKPESVKVNYLVQNAEEAGRLEKAIAQFNGSIGIRDAEILGDSPRLVVMSSADQDGVIIRPYRCAIDYLKQDGKPPIKISEGKSETLRYATTSYFFLNIPTSG